MGSSIYLAEAKVLISFAVNPCFCFSAYTINRFSRKVSLIYEPRSEKTGLRCFRPGPTQTGMYSHTRRQEV